MTRPTLKRYLPILTWGASYNRAIFGNDAMAAVTVIIMLIPQSLGYALLAGLPLEAGLYASIVPLVLYAVFGSSRVLAVGPVAVVSLMTAAALANIAEQGTMGYAVAALTLAGLSGAMLLAMGLAKLGFLANFLSHPVIAGFITASGILIATNQLRHILGVGASGGSFVEMLVSLAQNIHTLHWLTALIGASVIAVLYGMRSFLKPRLLRLGLRPRLADLVTKAGPLLVVVVSTALVWALALDTHGVRIVGVVPQGLPPLTLPSFSADLIGLLLLPALLIAVVGFVESVSVAQTLAARKRQRIDPDQELIGLGAANIGAAFTGGFPVTGGFARSVVNADAGAETPAAGAFTAIGLLIAAVALTPLIYYLPTATLAGMILVLVLSLVDLSILKRAWTYSRADFAAVAVTILLTLGVGVEAGLMAGVVLSIALHLYKTSRPHVAEVGLVPGTQHFRNILRHKVETHPEVLSIRIDESLYFANARYLEDYVQQRVVADSPVRHLVLMCSAVNEIDLSALESLEAISERLKDMGVTLHLSEVKGPVMDRLNRSDFMDHFKGRIFLSQFEAHTALTAPHGAA